MMGEGSWTYVLGMLATLWAACVSYLAPLDKRPHAKARVLGMLALAAAASGVSVLFQPLPIWVSLTSIFAFSILFFLVCGDMPLSARSMRRSGRRYPSSWRRKRFCCSIGSSRPTWIGAAGAGRGRRC